MSLLIRPEGSRAFLNENVAAGWPRLVVGLLAADQFKQGRNGFFHRSRLSVELFSSTGTLLGAGGICLRVLIHHANSGIDLSNAMALFARGAGNLGSEFVHLADS